MSREQFINEQKHDSSLGPLFDAVVSEEHLKKMSSGYFLKDGLLVRTAHCLSLFLKYSVNHTVKQAAVNSDRKRCQ